MYVCVRVYVCLRAMLTFSTSHMLQLQGLLIIQHPDLQIVLMI